MSAAAKKKRKKDREWGIWKEKKVREQREEKEGRGAVSDGFHVLRSRAELAPGGCGLTLMTQVLC